MQLRNYEARGQLQPSYQPSRTRPLITTHTRSPLRTMAHVSISTAFAGAENQGLQVGHNAGSIETHIHAPGKCLLPAAAQRYANCAMFLQSVLRPPAAVMLRTVPLRPRFHRSRGADRPDTRAMRCAGLSSRAGGPWRRWVRSAKGLSRCLT